MGAVNRVINSYSGKLCVISLGPLCLYDVGGVWFWEAAYQGHVSTWQSVDHFCFCDDIFGLALKANGKIFSASNV